VTTAFERAVDRHVRRIWLAFGEEVGRLREDAGLSRAALASAAGVDPSYLGDIEDGRANPSVVICTGLSLALGADLTLRAYPTTGPAVRDRHQAAIAESMLGLVNARWRRFAEIAVRHPSRGWIDLGLHDPIARQFVATEIQSELRRLEQLIRWSEAKAAALPSWDGWGQLGEAPAVSRLLVVRDTRTNRAVAADFRRLLRTAFPADPVEAVASLQAVGPWPGPSLLWAARDRMGPRAYRLAARP
jgi:transcriptional regulator with XRE-family HTH domain